MLRSGSVCKKCFFRTPGNFTWKNEAGTIEKERNPMRIDNGVAER
jgi:hypothetical protein